MNTRHCWTISLVVVCSFFISLSQGMEGSATQGKPKKTIIDSTEIKAAVVSRDYERLQLALGGNSINALMYVNKQELTFLLSYLIIHENISIEDIAWLIKEADISVDPLKSPSFYSHLQVRPLVAAIQAERLDIANYLLSKGANPNFTASDVKCVLKCEYTLFLWLLKQGICFVSQSISRKVVRYRLKNNDLLSMLAVYDFQNACKSVLLEEDITILNDALLIALAQVKNLLRETDINSIKALILAIVEKNNQNVDFYQALKGAAIGGNFELFFYIHSLALEALDKDAYREVMEKCLYWSAVHRNQSIFDFILDRFFVVLSVPHFTIQRTLYFLDDAILLYQRNDRLACYVREVVHLEGQVASRSPLSPQAQSFINLRSRLLEVESAFRALSQLEWPVFNQEQTIVHTNRLPNELIGSIIKYI